METNKQLLSSQILNEKYAIIRTINKRTYLARNLNSGYRVILKSFSFGLPESQWQGFNQIENEIHILKNLNHPQIPKYVDSFQIDNNFYLVQEFIKGEELSNQKVYLEEEIIDIAKQVLSILIYLSSQNPPVVHHDLKPDNILIDKYNKIYLIDFGISKQIKEQTIGITTQFGGTEGFIAPEKILGRNSNVRSDLYSLGITLACLLTRTPSSSAVSLLNDDFELRSGILDSYCSKELSDWVRGLIKRKPDDRYLDAVVAAKKLTEMTKKTIRFGQVNQAEKKLDKDSIKRKVEINETEYIKKVFTSLTIVLTIYSTFFSILLFLPFNLCCNLEFTGFSISFANMIEHGLIGYLPWIGINQSLSALVNFYYNFISYWISFLIVSVLILMVTNTLIKEQYYRLKYIFLRCLLSGYGLLILFVFKTYLIG